MRLNPARTMFIQPSQKARASKGSLKPLAPSQMPQHTPPMTRLVSGPARATRNSIAGFCGSSVIWETPPRMNRVMDLMRIPAACATRLCAISCIRSDMKKRRLVASPMSQ